MSKDYFWEEFVKTGRISNYLAYRDSDPSPSDSSSGAPGRNPANTFRRP